MKPNEEAPDQDEQQLELTAAVSGRPELKDTALVLSLLEADQVVAAKRQSRFGQRKLSLGMRILLWGLRIYVIVMLVLVVVSVFRAIRASY